MLTSHDLDLSITTAEQVLHLMELGDIWIERSSRDGFYCAVERMSGMQIPINQSLARSVSKDSRVTRQEWRQGWEVAMPTGPVRWLIGMD